MPGSWHDLLRTLDPALSPDDVTLRRRAKPAPPADGDAALNPAATVLHDACIDPVAILSASIGDAPHICAVLDALGFVVHVVAAPQGAAADRGWVRGARVFERGPFHDELLAARPVVAAGDGGEELLMPLCARGTPVVGMLALACNPAQLPRTAAATIMATTQAIALTTQLAELREQDQRTLGTIGHELRQPLSALVTALDVLARTAQVPVSALRIAQRQAHQLTQLVEALLDASQLSRGKRRLPHRLLDLRDVVRDGVDTVRADVEAKEQHLHVAIPERPVWSSGDAARLQQVVVNLVSNGSRYTPARGTITVSLGGDGSRVKITVADTGEGIDAEAREHIFQPFMHGGSSKGLGLGLTISRAIADLHGGTLIAESGGRGHGSVFVLELPGVMERTREVREAVTRTREETRGLIERARTLRASLGPHPPKLRH